MLAIPKIDQSATIFHATTVLKVRLAERSSMLANKHPKLVDINRRQELIQMYEKEWELAREEDRERASFYVQPKVRGYA